MDDKELSFTIGQLSQELKDFRENISKDVSEMKSMFKEFIEKQDKVNDDNLEAHRAIYRTVESKVAKPTLKRVGKFAGYVAGIVAALTALAKAFNFFK